MAMGRAWRWDEVRAHHQKDDLWLVIDNGVYDCTEWISKHPGGDVLLHFGGRDATDAFAAFHEPNVRKRLQAFQVGVLDERDRDVPEDLREFRKLRDQLWKEGWFEPCFEGVAMTLITLACTAAACLWFTIQCRSRMAHLAGGIGITTCTMLSHKLQMQTLQRDALPYFALTLFRQRARDMVLMAGYVLYVSKLLSFLPTSERWLYFFAANSVTGILHLILNMNHYCMPMQESMESADKMGFFRFQLTGTSNIKSNVLQRWYYGGLEHQIEHHLFPLMPRYNLARVEHFVVELAKKHKVPYKTFGFFGANWAVLKTLGTVCIK